MQILFKNKLVDYQDDLMIVDTKIGFGNNPIKLDSRAKYIVPGFIDQHVHGLNGLDFHMHSDKDLNTVAQAMLKDGVTSFYATTATDSIEKLEKTIQNLVDYKFEDINMLGVHLEGPFISKTFKGAQNEKHVISGSKELFDRLNIDGVIKIISLAVEENLDWISELKTTNVKVLNAHSNALYNQVSGVDGITHFGNAHSQITSRQLGVMGAGLLNEDLYLELICDLEHLSLEFLKLVVKSRDISKLMLITDSILLKGLENKVYEFEDYKITKTDKTVKLDSGKLVGSILSMNDAIKNIAKVTTLENAFLMASKNVCDFNNITSKGVIDVGYDFDVVTLDEDLNVVEVYVAGKKVV